MKGWTKEMVRVTVETNYPFCNGVTKDEALQLAHDLLCELKQTRKETAEKFAEKVHNLFNRDIKDSVVYTQEEKDILKDFVNSIDELLQGNHGQGGAKWGLNKNSAR